MAERRMVSKVISISEKVNSMSLFGRLLYTWMIPHADDFGRMPGSPAKVRALVVPMGDETTKEVESALTDMHERGLILWYEVAGDKFIQIANFEEHQQGLHKRTTSKFPDPPNGNDDFPGSSGKFPLEGKGIGREIEQKGMGTAPPDFSVHVQNLLVQNQVEDYSIIHIENIASYHGLVDVEVIEYAIAKAKKKHVNYALRTLEGLVKDGKTSKDSVQYIRAVPDKPAKTDPELESRRIEIARNKWISEGNDPDEFNYAASGDRGRTSRIRSGVP